MNDATLAYIAGLFDGEGSVYFKQTKQIRPILIQIQIYIQIQTQTQNTNTTQDQIRIQYNPKKQEKLPTKTDML